MYYTVYPGKSKLYTEGRQFLTQPILRLLKQLSDVLRNELSTLIIILKN